jgi:hypothetical protein
MSEWLELLIQFELPLSRRSAIPTNRCGLLYLNQGCSKVLTVEFQK